MNTYETIIIFKTDTIDDKFLDYQKLFSSFDDTTEIDWEDMGDRKLAYSIKGDTIGHYIKVIYNANPDDIPKLEHRFRLDDDTLKFITVRHDIDSESKVELKPKTKTKDEQFGRDIMLGIYDNTIDI